MKPLFLFDIDGTLVDSPIKAGRRAFERALEAVAGFEAGLRGITLHGNTDLIILEEAWQVRRSTSPTPEESRQVLEEYLRQLEIELQTPGAMRCIPGVQESLQYWKEKALFGLATGNIIEGARLKLAHVGLWEHFALGGYGSDSADRAVLIRCAIERAEKLAGISYPRNRVYVIGDTPKDVAAAKRAGVRSIAVATGTYPKTELQETGADFVIADLRELSALGLESDSSTSYAEKHGIS